MNIFYRLFSFLVFLLIAFPVEAVQSSNFFLAEYNRRVVTQNPSATSQQGPVYTDQTKLLADQLQLYTVNSDTRYRIEPGDTLTISFNDRAEVNKANYLVSIKGDIALPLLGVVQVQGLNRKQIREQLNMLYKQYIRKPNVAVMINTDGKIMVAGAVLAPGVYQITPQMTVMEALLQAQGYDKNKAKLASVVVIRGSAEKSTLLKLDLKKMIRSGDRADNIYVKPGDMIFVPTTTISHLERFWDNAYKYLLNWYGLGGEPPFGDGPGL